MESGHCGHIGDSVLNALDEDVKPSQSVRGVTAQVPLRELGSLLSRDLLLWANRDEDGRDEGKMVGGLYGAGRAPRRQPQVQRAIEVAHVGHAGPLEDPPGTRRQGR